MWRSHCPRLTRELRAGARNAPFIPRSYSQDVSHTTHVSTEEFWGLFTAIWPYQKKADAPKIGVAVSGGVDSMALASLCSRAAKEYAKFPDCVGLIVDHKLREGSSEEALWVAEQLRTHAGMPSLILPLQWPGNPNELNDFETQARQLRYRALGLACREHALRSILVAHHANDQAETIIMRLIAGRVRTGMRGIQAVRDIPECHGIHGVHRSGGLDLLPKPGIEERQHYPIGIETGGVKIVRPLLSLSKDRLIATCLANEMPWVEDKTNSDRTLTERNAIRHTLQHHRLPLALQRESLVNVSERMQGRIEEASELAERLFKRCDLRLDVRVGVVRVHFGKARLAINELAATDKVLANSIAAQLIGFLTAMVTPLDVVRTNQLDNAVERIFPVFESMKDSGPLKPFTVGGVMFIPNLPGQPGHMPETPFEWTIGREPYKKSRGLPVLEIPPRNIDPAVIATNPLSAGYQLFDGRFWVRIVNPTDQRVHFRPLHKEDLSQLDESMKRRIRTVAALPLRETLPVLTKFDAQGKEYIIALPTLGIRLGSRGFVGGIRWTIRYKKLDIDGLNPLDILDNQYRFERKADKRNEKTKRSDTTMSAARKARNINIALDTGH